MGHVTQPLVFTDLSCLSDQTGQTRAYYVLLQKPSPEVGLYLISVRYDSTVISPLKGGGAFSTRRLSFIALSRARMPKDGRRCIGR